MSSRRWNPKRFNQILLSYSGNIAQAVNWMADIKQYLQGETVL